MGRSRAPRPADAPRRAARDRPAGRRGAGIAGYGDRERRSAQERRCAGADAQRADRARAAARGLRAAGASPPARRKPPDPPQLEPVQDLPPDAADAPVASIGKPWKGRLRDGVQFPEGGASFFTFDSALPHVAERLVAALGHRHERRANARRPARSSTPRTRTAAGRRRRPEPATRRALRARVRRPGAQVAPERRRRRPVLPAQGPPRGAGRESPARSTGRWRRSWSTASSPRARRWSSSARESDCAVRAGVVMKLVHHDDHVHVRWPTR